MDARPEARRDRRPGDGNSKDAVPRWHEYLAALAAAQLGGQRVRLPLEGGDLALELGLARVQLTQEVVLFGDLGGRLLP